MVIWVEFRKNNKNSQIDLSSAPPLGGHGTCISAQQNLRLERVKLTSESEIVNLVEW